MLHEAIRGYVEKCQRAGHLNAMLTRENRELRRQNDELRKLLIDNHLRAEAIILLLKES